AARRARARAHARDRLGGAGRTARRAAPLREPRDVGLARIRRGGAGGSDAPRAAHRSAGPLAPRRHAARRAEPGAPAPTLRGGAMTEARTPRASQVVMTQAVMPGDANPLGTAFGGRIAQWIDVAGGIACQRHCRHRVVTASID